MIVAFDVLECRHTICAHSIYTGGNTGKQKEARMEAEPMQDALFQIEGPDEDGCVWVCAAEGRDVWCQNLGPKDEVVEVLSQWLASVDDADAA